MLSFRASMHLETPEDIFTTAFSKLTPDEQYHYTKQRTNFGDAVNEFIKEQKGSLISLDKDFRRTLQRYNHELIHIHALTRRVRGDV